MPSKIDPYWVDQLTQSKCEHEGWGAPRLYSELDRIAHTARELVSRLRDSGQRVAPDLASHSNPPSERFISQWLRTEWPNVSPDERLKYRLLRWPDSFERGMLPWEAAPACLDLLLFRRRLADYLPTEWRPTVRIARWFHRASLATPGLSVEHRHALAFAMAAVEVGLFPMRDWPFTAADIEAYLMFREQPDMYTLLTQQRLIDLDTINRIAYMGYEHDEGLWNG